jgi:periplasmic protein TonB
VISLVNAAPDWPVAARWLVALAFSTAVHGGLAWEAVTLIWPRTAWTEVVIPVDLSMRSDEVSRPDPPARAPRRMLSPPTPRQPERVESAAALPAASLQKAEEPPRSTPAEPATVSATVEPTVSPPAAPAPADPAAGAPGAARGEVTAPATARDEALRTPLVAATSPSASLTPRITQPARPRGGYQVRPAYPEAARRTGTQGTTVLRVHVEADGSIHEVQVQQSAGHAALDQAAVDAVARWRFDPARSGSDAVAVWVLIPVEFRIKSAF